MLLNRNGTLVGTPEAAFMRFIGAKNARYTCPMASTRNSFLRGAVPGSRGVACEEAILSSIAKRRGASSRAGVNSYDRFALSNNAQRLPNFRKCVGSLQELLALVRRTDNRAQPRLVLRHGRVPNRWRIYPSIKKLIRKLERLRRIPDMNRNDRSLADLELKSPLLQLALEEFRVRPQFLHQPLALRRIQQGKRRLASRRSRRRGRRRKQKRTRPQGEGNDQIPGAANVPAHRANRLAQRAHLDVHAPVTIQMINRPAPAAPQHPRRMRVIHHHDAVVFFRQLAQRR